MLSDSGRRNNAVPAQLAAISAAAALRAGVFWSGEVPICDGSVMLPSVGKIIGLSDTAGWLRVVTCDGTLEVTGQDRNMKFSAPFSADQPGWQGLRSLHAASGNKQARVIIEDLDYYRALDSPNVDSRLPATDLSQWQYAFAGAWDLLVRHHSHVAAEVALMVRAFTPLMRPAGGQVSATSRQTFGSIALSAPSDARSLAVTIAHEIQHAKLSALLDVIPMTLPDDGARYYAPWRDDLRPISGLLQGAYAFLGVAAFWQGQRLCESGQQAALANVEFARWRTAVGLVIRTLLDSGRLTDQGHIFVTGMAHALAALTTDRVPAEAASLAMRAAEQHRTLRERRGGRAEEETAAKVRLS